jgi:hypothetical protein
MKNILFVFLAFSLFSCTDIKKTEQISAINKMFTSLDSIETVLFNNEIDTIAALNLAAMGVELRIKNNYYSDTIDMELGKKMDAYKLTRRSLSPLGRSYSVIKKGVKDERVVLSKLKDDIEKGNGERKKYSDYVKFEEDKTNQLRSLLNGYLVEKEKTMKTFFSLYEELNAFSLELLEKRKK